MYVIIKVHITLCNNKNFSFTHRKLKLFPKIKTKYKRTCRSAISNLFLFCTFEVLCTFEQDISATVQDKILKWSENNVFSYNISGLRRK